MYYHCLSSFIGPRPLNLGCTALVPFPKRDLVNATLPRKDAPLRVHMSQFPSTSSCGLLFFLLTHLITEDLLKYSSAMYHCAPFSRRILHTLPLRLPSPFHRRRPSLSVASKVLHNHDDSSPCPGFCALL